MTTLVLASNNPGKVREFNQLLDTRGIQVVAQGEYDVSAAAETGLTFVENALLKARHAARQTGRPALADDSGLEVDALSGAPGIHSARFAGEQGNDSANNALLLERLQEVPADARQARFVCVLALLRHAEDPRPLICEATWEGYIADQATGSGGFGYDPLFYVPSEDSTAAGLSAERKGEISHRARASRELLSRIRHWLA